MMAALRWTRVSPRVSHPHNSDTAGAPVSGRLDPKSLRTSEDKFTAARAVSRKEFLTCGISTSVPELLSSLDPPKTSRFQSLPTQRRSRRPPGCPCGAGPAERRRAPTQRRAGPGGFSWGGTQGEEHQLHHKEKCQCSFWACKRLASGLQAKIGGALLGRISVGLRCCSAL